MFSLSVIVCELCTGATPQRLGVVQQASFAKLDPAKLAEARQKWRQLTPGLCNFVQLLIAEACSTLRPFFFSHNTTFFSLSLFLHLSPLSLLSHILHSLSMLQDSEIRPSATAILADDVV
jgi:hypothetical protein